ncbi:motility associated factor glycosyltransferase family protein [Campylobacter lari]|uniref:motility associated factor glycosyltransferase family protein n=2 Tax=Campylobacter lari TaxID=201 RepID=UPI00127ADCE4|nr:motility associated factor glycosyltransferase family protein [Campylobacter lari]MBT0818522.1 motility associated factor glycosyltransferase family protein [Campylobacter lari]MBT0833792.1 motility associated factor glycosyltransferase family protein [Campylobacter lari]
MNELFLKNTQALFEKDQPLALKLRELKECEQFELFQGSSDNLDINILDKKRKEFIYKDPLKELDESLKLFNGEYLRYPVLFFYGLGNGILYKALLSNPIRNHLIIFEEELEIIYLVFHYLDLSEEIRNEKVVLFCQANFNNLVNFLENKGINTLLRLYNLHIKTNYHEKHHKENILNTNSIALKTIKYIADTKGNSPLDSLQGITQLLHNLPYQLANPSLKDLLKQRKGKIENAIIVSTGPSLIKQLPLLKEYANKASIICADTAYPILAKHNIKPDYVLMLERDDIVIKCFDNDFKEFDKGILFVLASVVHQKAIEYLKRNNRQFMLVHRPLPFSKALHMDDYGYLGTGMSVANMAYELAIKLGHKNIILIGQDLAYDENGNSHPKDYVHGETIENDRKTDLFITAYGGNGKVETNIYWDIFRKTFQRDIELVKKINITTYNATEGGARIEGALEITFSKICKEFLKKTKPHFAFPIKNQEKLEKCITKTHFTIDKQLNILSKYLQQGKVLLSQIDKIFKNKSNKNILSLIKKIDSFKIKVYKNPFVKSELFEPLFFHLESNLAIIYVKPINTEEEKSLKNIEWLKANKEWLENFISFLTIQNEIIKKVDFKAL